MYTSDRKVFGSVMGTGARGRGPSSCGSKDESEDESESGGVLGALLLVVAVPSLSSDENDRVRLFDVEAVD